MLKIISKYSKTGNLKYISHLDVLRFIQRAVKRAGITAAYSEGFNPHMRTSFGFPLSLGNESIGEYFELELIEKIDINEFIEKMNSVLPQEMQILKASYTEEMVSIMARSAYVEYIMNLEFNDLDTDKLNDFIDEMIETGVIYSREKKDKKNKTVFKEINTRDFIKSAEAKKISDSKATIEAVFVTSEKGSMKTEEFIKIIEKSGFNLEYHSIMKVDSLDKNMKPILN